MSLKPILRTMAAEMFGTFALVFAGTGAIIVNVVTGGVVGHLGIALTFGLVVLAMIYAVGDVSGAHLNPAVSIAFVVARRFPPRNLLPYVIAQSGGAVFASLLLRTQFPENRSLGVTTPFGPPLRAFLFEIVMTWLLMFVILRVSTGEKEKGITAGIAVGAVIMLEALFGGPISGASMNPARSLAPAAVSGTWGGLWIYILGPVIGAILAVPTHHVARNP